jgi:WD40 repeat protein
MRSVLLLLLLPPALLAQGKSPSYSRDIRPFLTRYCLECHNATDPEGGLNLETVALMREGGKRGPAIVPGKPDEGPLVRMIEGKLRPVMPPKKSRQPSADEVALVRAWVLAGAIDDSTSTLKRLPSIAVKARIDPPVTALAFSPDGKRLAAAGRGEVLLFDPASDSLLARVPAGRDRVTALAFSADGRHLALAASTAGEGHEIRVVPLRDGLPADAARLLGKHDDLIHELAFNPAGTLLASAGYDRLIHLHDLASGKLLRTLRDHSDSVYGVTFSPDGQLLASAGADRAVKVWDVASGNRLYTLGESTDWVYSVAWSPDGKHLAAGSVDRSIRIWSVNNRQGQIVSATFAHEGPVLRLAYSRDGKTLYSLGEERVAKAWATDRMTERRTYPAQAEAVLSLAVTPDEKILALGRFDGVLWLVEASTGKTIRQLLPRPAGQSAPVHRFGAVGEIEPNDSPRTGQPITLPVTLIGTIGRAGDTDWFRFEAQPGQEVGVEAVTGKIGSTLSAYLQLVDPQGNIVAESGLGHLGHVCRLPGSYALGIRDLDYRGDAKMTYRLNVGPVPVVTSYFPLGLQRGSTVEVQLEGVHLGDGKRIRVSAAGDAAPGTRLAVAAPAGREPPLGLPSLVVGEFPESADVQKPLRVPGTVNGVVATPHSAQTWRFEARKGQRLILEVQAARLGSPLDSLLEIVDEAGQPLPRAVLRSLARTFVAFRDHDSRNPGIRLETWSELAVNDYLLVGNELLRIHALPRNPDDDCRFYERDGQRLGFLGTTPTFQPQATPMYKVSIHPPGTRFAPNGLPVVTIPWRNDDGGPGFGKDSRLVFDPPADGVYRLRITDSRGEGSPAHAYRLTVRPPRPDFTVRLSSPGTLPRGSAVPVRIDVRRQDEFDGDVQVQLTGLPAGFSAPGSQVGPSDNGTAIALFAEANAVAPKGPTSFEVQARARIDGKEVVRTARANLPSLSDPGDLIVTTQQSEVTIQPGRETRVTVQIERRNGFTGRVPLDVQGLPHGVRVLDVGLNGILVIPGQTTRTFVLYCEPWVKPLTQPLVVVARREGKPQEYAARAVLLRVVP